MQGTRLYWLSCEQKTGGNCINPWEGSFCLVRHSMSMTNLSQAPALKCLAEYHLEVSSYVRKQEALEYSDLFWRAFGEYESWNDDVKRLTQLPANNSISDFSYLLEHIMIIAGLASPASCRHCRQHYKLSSQTISNQLGEKPDMSLCFFSIGIIATLVHLRHQSAPHDVT
eukprot:scaffold2859_cov101-Cylindrotheca_fusiformis.AAC.3